MKGLTDKQKDSIIMQRIASMLRAETVKGTRDDCTVNDILSVIHDGRKISDLLNADAFELFEIVIETITNNLNYFSKNFNVNFSDKEIAQKFYDAFVTGTHLEGVVNLEEIASNINNIERLSEILEVSTDDINLFIKYDFSKTEKLRYEVIDPNSGLVYNSYADAEIAKIDILKGKYKSDSVIYDTETDQEVEFSKDKNFSAKALDNKIQGDSKMKAKARFFANAGDIAYIPSSIIPEGIAFQQELDGTVAVKLLKDTTDLLFVPVEIVTSGEKIEVPAFTDDVSNFSRKVIEKAKAASKNFEVDPTDPTPKKEETVEKEIKAAEVVNTVVETEPKVETKAEGKAVPEPVSTVTPEAPVQTPEQEKVGEVKEGDPVIDDKKVEEVQDKQIENAVIEELNKDPEVFSKSKFPALKALCGKNWID